MSASLTVAELLRELAAVMAERRLRWYLFGAQAAILWGSPRLSADADVTAQIEPAGIDGFIETMRRHGFDLLFGDPELVERTRVLPFVHRGTRMPVDVVLGGPGLEEDFLQRAVPVNVHGTQIPVISPEDLIVTKILAGRPKDIEDVRNVIHARKPALDVERIRSILRLLEQALVRSDLLPLIEKELHEQSAGGLSKKAKRHPGKK
ncbi:MAG TPA: nucleotidyl transferase AbiEii/AbiGii toxin family protein [Thermoanaerobaculia bacterium]|nr:nucleotidyl transferase AbiEii/AbiGii toxin family protein [Thermoanaerobaculia bacterium]